jgi:hypothetical protein
MTPEEIVRKLTKAQRNYLTTKAEFCRLHHWSPKQWMTFPPKNTHDALIRLGLVNRSGKITAVGRIIRRNLLLESSHDQ